MKSGLSLERDTAYSLRICRLYYACMYHLVPRDSASRPGPIRFDLESMVQKQETRLLQTRYGNSQAATTAIIHSTAPQILIFRTCLSFIYVGVNLNGREERKRGHVSTPIFSLHIRRRPLRVPVWFDKPARDKGASHETSCRWAVEHKGMHGRFQRWSTWHCCKIWILIADILRQTPCDRLASIDLSHDQLRCNISSCLSMMWCGAMQAQQ